MSPESETVEAAPTTPAPPLRVEVWSDVVCPFCWIGKRHLEAAVQKLGLDGEVEVVFRAFELNPTLTRSGPLTDYLAQKFGSVAQAERVRARVVEMGRAAGLALDFERAIAAPTFDAHRLVALATERGRGVDAAERLARAHFVEGLDVSDRATLARLGVEVGLDAREVEEALSTGRYADRVRTDQAMARGYQIGGVPFTVVDGRYGVSGAQPVEVFVEALRRARDERAAGAGRAAGAERAP